MRNLKLKSIIILAFLFLIVPLPLLILLIKNFPQEEARSLIFVLLGSLSYIAMLTNIVLGSKPKILDKMIGLPNVYLIHMLFAFLIGIPMLIHKLSLSANNLVSFFGDAGLAMFAGICAISIFYYSSWVTKLIPSLLPIKKQIEKIVKRELSIWGHRLLLLATLLVFIHVSLIDYIRKIPYFYPLFVAYTLIAFAIYLLYVKDFYLNKANSKISQVSALDQDIFSLKLKTRKNLQSYKPGKFVFISFSNNEKLKAPHPFSIVDVDKNSGEITFGILDNGDFTHIIKDLKVGQAAKISKAYGVLPDLINKIDDKTDLVVILGGIGITPFVTSLDNVKNKTYIFYSVKKDKNLLYTDKFVNPNITLFTQKERFTFEDIKEKVPDLKNSFFFISGPDPMIDDMTKDLKNQGINEAQIFCESFSW